jgi:WD40 repeat protein
VWSIAYSPDGQHIVSGSNDGIIRIWDAETGAAVGKPLDEHNGGGVDSCCLLSRWATYCLRVRGHTVRIWDAKTGAAIGQPLKGHTDLVRCVAFSPDGRHIASGSYDCTIRIWDVKTGVAVGNPLEGHTDAVNVLLTVLMGSTSSLGPVIAPFESGMPKPVLLLVIL